jgi:catechol 2,3-dioxygenase-like lactoylglutathione lyase family enzyme
MLHHVGIEVAPADLERSVELWRVLGFERVEPPASLSEFIWVEREGTQIHLMPTNRPTIPPRGHVAIVTPDFESAVAALREHGFEVELRRGHWDSPRAIVIAPGGHQVELMAAPPSAAETQG